LAHRGGYDQFCYGYDHPGNRSGQLQWCIVCYIGSGVIAIDVDDEQAYLTTRTSRFVGRAQAISVRGPGYHAIIDARGVPDGQWPKQVPICGADIKSRGFIPVPGSWHWSGEQYRPVFDANGLTTVVPATPALIRAILADQADAKSKSGRDGRGGNGGGHDGQVAATVLGNVLRGLSKGQCYMAWRRAAVAHDPDWPFDDADFERHHRGAVRKAAEIRAAEQQLLRSTPRSQRHTGG
jgi:hypothetical protein